MAARKRKNECCPVCDKPSAEKYRPFCSERCMEVDLGRWLQGSYAVPGGAEDRVGEEEEN